MNDLISVIVPVYKVEPYLHKCVDSILGQTYSNLEVILVDDGSPDNCGAICDEYAVKDNRVKVIHKENSGPASTRNLGIDAATGDWITFIDSDDWVSLDHLETLLLCGESYADIVMSDVCYVSEDGNPLFSFTYQKLSNIVHESAFGYLYNKLYRSSFLGTLRLPNLCYAEDLIFNLRLAQASPLYTFTKKATYFYRQVSNSLTRREVTTKKLDDFIAFANTAWEQLLAMYGNGESALCEYNHFVANLTCNFCCDISLSKSYSMNQKKALFRYLLSGIPANRFKWRYAKHTLSRLLFLAQTLHSPSLFLLSYQIISFFKRRRR